MRKVFDEFDKRRRRVHRRGTSPPCCPRRGAPRRARGLGMQDVVTTRLWARVSKSEFGEEEAAQAERTLQLYHVSIAKSGEGGRSHLSRQ